MYQAWIMTPQWAALMERKAAALFPTAAPVVTAVEVRPPLPRVQKLPPCGRPPPDDPYRGEDAMNYRLPGAGWTRQR